jgi:hypothetical protein
MGKGEKKEKKRKQTNKCQRNLIVILHCVNHLSKSCAFLKTNSILLESPEYQ